MSSMQDCAAKTAKALYCLPPSMLPVQIDDNAKLFQNTYPQFYQSDLQKKPRTELHQDKPTMNFFAANAAKALFCMPPKMLASQLDGNAKVFYNTYTELYKPEVQKIPHTEQHQRKRTMNNITGRAGKLKKDYIVLVLANLIDYIIDGIAMAAEEFDNVTRPLIQADAVPSDLQRDVDTIGQKIVAFRSQLAEWSAKGTSIHDAIKETARKEGNRASKRKFEEKLAEAAVSPNANDLQLNIDTLPQNGLSTFISPCEERLPFVNTPPTQPHVTSPFTPDTGMGDFSFSITDLETSFELPVSTEPFTPAITASEFPLYRNDFESSLELPFSPEPFTPVLDASEFQLPPTIAQVALPTTPTTPVPPSTAGRIRRSASDSSALGDIKKTVTNKMVTRSIKNNAAATRTNHTRKWLVSIYRSQVEKYSVLRAEIRDVNMAISRNSKFMHDSTMFSLSHGAA